MDYVLPPGGRDGLQWAMESGPLPTKRTHDVYGCNDLHVEDGKPLEGSEIGSTFRADNQDARRTG